jgi:phosphosulfolactate synthase (CoM biosynthesis protein A)
MTRQKGFTPDVRPKLINDMVSKIERICKDKGCQSDKGLIQRHVEQAIDKYVEEWYEVSLEAIDLQDGDADYTTDEFNDEELIQEARLRVIKDLYDERPQDMHQQIADSVIKEMEKK